MRPTLPFQAQGEISPGKNIDLRCTTAGSTSPCLGHNSFAVDCPLALPGSAFYPVPVRRPAASLHASFTPASRSDALRFTSLAVTSSREDFHLLVNAHAGRTANGSARKRRPMINSAKASGAAELPAILHVSRSGWSAAISGPVVALA